MRERETETEREAEREKGVYGLMVIVVGNGHDDLSSDPALGCLHFT